MSGLSGHMLNLWEDLSLTKADLKEIIQRSFENRFCFKEKIDGFNIHFFIKEGKIRFARNKQDLLNGGMGPQEIFDRWQKNKFVYDIYMESYRILQNTIDNSSRGLPTYTPQFKNSIITYNCDCFKSGITNVIPYKHAGVTIHNIWEWDLDSNEVIIKDFNEVNKGCFVLLNDPCIYIEFKAPYKSLYKYYNGIIDTLFDQCNTIEELYQREFLTYLMENFKDVYGQPEYIKHIFNRIFKNDNSFNLRDLKKAYKYSEETYGQNIISSIIDIKQDIKYTCYGELRRILIEIGDVLLSGADYYTNQYYKYKAQSEVHDEIFNIINKCSIKDNDEYRNRLNKYFKEWQLMGSIINPIEGIVFDYNNQTYKWTGSFSIINKIIGLSKSYNEKF